MPVFSVQSRQQKWRWKTAKNLASKDVPL
jgi:hypothetical protein